MKKIQVLLCLGALAVLLEGCVAFPPLIQVQHKEDPAQNQEILKRLDAIDHRLDAIEKVDKKP